MYSSHLTTWRKAVRSGWLKSAVEETRSKAGANGIRWRRKCASWSGENTRLEKELRKARLIIDVQGKVAGLLGIEPRGRDELVKAAEALATYVGVKPACDALEGRPSHVLSSSEAHQPGISSPARPQPVP